MHSINKSDNVPAHAFGKAVLVARLVGNQCAASEVINNPDAATVHR
jgi:hypothetical protein